MRIFATGATGFIGGHFVEECLAAGHEVAGIYHSESEEKKAFIEHLRRQGAQLARADVLDEQGLPALLRGADCVCHFAAAFRETGVGDEHFQRLNVEAVEKMVRASAAAGVRRFVLCSTAGIYGQRVRGVVDERAVPRPWNIYESTKLAGEMVARSLTAELGIEHVVLRPTAVYGPRDQRLLKLFRSAAKGRFPLFGSGDGRRHMVYVTDLAEAFVKACESPAALGKDFIVGGPRAVPLHEMLETLAGTLGRPSCGPRLPLKPMQWLSGVVEDTCGKLGVRPPVYRRRMDFYISDVEFSTARAQRILEWRPMTDLQEGLAKTLASYRQEGRLHSSPASLMDIAGATAAPFLASQLWPLAGTFV